MFDYVGVFIVLALAVLFGWLVMRAWGSKKAWLKWLGVVLGGLLTVIFALVFVFALLGFAKLNTNYNADHPASSVKVAGTPEQVKRGEKIVQGCSCHITEGTTKPGGNDFTAGGGPPLGTFWARNLTPGGELKDWTDGEIIRAIREGVHKSGRSLVIMPSDVFWHMSDDDAQAIVAYLRSVPPITPDAPPNNLSLVGALFVNVAPVQTVQPHITAPIARVPNGATAEYGKYVTTIWCVACHGTNLAGGKEGGAPVGSNLTAIIPKWSEADFVKLIRTGILPDGKTVSEDMPWKKVSVFADDDDLRGLYLYLHSLKELPTNPTK